MRVSVFCATSFFVVFLLCSFIVHSLFAHITVRTFGELMHNAGFLMNVEGFIADKHSEMLTDTMSPLR